MVMDYLIILCRKCTKDIAVTREVTLDPDFYFDEFDRPSFCAMVRCPHCRYMNSLEATLTYTQIYSVS